jgi:hypothetical protein
MFKDEIEINQLKKNQFTLIFETGDSNHEPGTDPIAMKKN